MNMKTLARQKLDVVHKPRSNAESFRGWRGQFTPEFVERGLRDATILR